MTPLQKERLRIVRELDIEGARKVYDEIAPIIGEPAEGDITILAGLHKARVMAGEMFTKKERQLSKRWLRGNGYGVPGETKISPAASRFKDMRH